MGEDFDADRMRSLCASSSYATFMVSNAIQAF
jgi:hypothetical protein